MPMPAKECAYPLYGALDAVMAVSLTSYGMLKPCRAAPVALVTDALHCFTDELIARQSASRIGGMADASMSFIIASIAPWPRELNISLLTASITCCVIKPLTIARSMLRDGS